MEPSHANGNKRWLGAFDASKVSVFLIDPSSDQIVDANETAARLLGYSLAELIHTSISKIHPGEMEKLRGFSEQVFNEGAAFSDELSCTTKSGDCIPAEMSGSILNIDGRELMMALVTDVSEKRQAEATRMRLEKAIEQSSDVITITDSTGVIQYVNPAFEKLTGFSADEAIGKSTSILHSGEHDASFYEKLWKTLEAGDVWVGRFVNRRKDGALVIHESTISPVTNPDNVITNYVDVKRDVTREVELEEQLRHKHQLESLGRLAGGVAHDLNNLLSPILGFSEILRDGFAPEDPRRANLDRVVRASSDAGKLVSQLLAFGRKQYLELRELCWCGIVSNLIPLLERTLPEDIEIEFNPCDPPYLIEADAAQMDQVLINLVLNARDAMLGGGRIELRLGRTNADEVGTWWGRDVDRGEYVMLQVIDDGMGFEQDELLKIFEPFYTTKGPGAGTGLGLASVLGIVEQHRGYVRAQQNEGPGATFTVLLPEVTNRHEEILGEAHTEAIRGGSESILIAEDDFDVREMTRAALMRLGYRVTAVSSGEEALALVEEMSSSFDLVLTDVVMGGISGPRLLESMKEISPSTRTMMMSGYPDDQLLGRGGVQEGVLLLRKPVSVSVLGARIREVLDG